MEQFSKRTQQEQLWDLVSGLDRWSLRAKVSRCAAMHGISPEIVARAEQFIELSAKGEDLVAVCAVLPRHEVDRLRDSVSDCYLAHIYGTYAAAGDDCERLSGCRS